MPSSGACSSHGEADLSILGPTLRCACHTRTASIEANRPVEAWHEIRCKHPLEGLPDLEDSSYLDSFASVMLVLEICERCQGFLQAPEPDELDRGEFPIGIGVEMFHVEDDLVKLTNRRRGCFPVAGFYEDTGCMDDADTAFEDATIESPSSVSGLVESAVSLASRMRSSKTSKSFVTISADIVLLRMRWPSRSGTSVTCLVRLGCIREMVCGFSAPGSSVVPFWYHMGMAMNLRVPEDLDRRLEKLAAEEHTSKSALLLQGAELVLQRHARRREISEGLDFVMSHDAELLTRLEDA